MNDYAYNYFDSIVNNQGSIRVLINFLKINAKVLEK